MNPGRLLTVRRRVLVCVSALTFALAACSVQEQTQGWHPRYDGQPAEAGDIGLRNVLVVTSDNGQATVLTSFANRGAEDQLVEVQVGNVTATPPNGPLEIPARGYASLAAGSDQIQVSGADLTPGRLVEVEFRFAKAPRVSVDALVKEAAGRYADVTFPEPTGTETPTTDS